MRIVWLRPVSWSFLLFAIMTPCIPRAQDAPEIPVAEPNPNPEPEPEPTLEPDPSQDTQEFKNSRMPPVRLEPERLSLPDDIDFSRSHKDSSTPDALLGNTANDDSEFQRKKEKGTWDKIIDPVVLQEEITSRHFLGAGLSYSNHGITKGLFGVSDDTVLKGHVSEKMFNLFLLVDLGWQENSIEAFRIRWGLGRVGLGIPDDIRNAYAAGLLEEQLSLMTLDFTLKSPLNRSAKDMQYWWGGGLNLHYAFSSQTSSSGGARASQLRHSSSISPVLSMGADLNSGNAQQVFLQGDWILFKAIQFSIGLRTRL